MIPWLKMTRETETVDEDPTSTEAQFEEASITIRSHQVNREREHICRNSVFVILNTNN